MDKLSDSSDHFSENLILFSACDKTDFVISTLWALSIDWSAESTMAKRSKTWSLRAPSSGL